MLEKGSKTKYAFVIKYRITPSEACSGPTVHKEGREVSHREPFHESRLVESSRW